MNKTVSKNAANTLSNIAPKTSITLTTSNSKNVGVIATASKASEDRKTGGNATFTNPTEYSATTSATVFQSQYLNYSVVVVFSYERSSQSKIKS